MWLPKPIYKALPATYAVTGVLFIAGANYLGIRDPMGPIYLGLGALSIIASITVTYWRVTYPGGRMKADKKQSQPDPSKSTDSDS